MRKRLEKRMEVTLPGSISCSDPKSILKIRSATPRSNNSSPNFDNADFINNNEFTHSIQYVGNLDQIESVKNSIAMKLIRTYRDKSSGLLNLVFDFIFWPSKSFMYNIFIFKLIIYDK